MIRGFRSFGYFNFNKRPTFSKSFGKPFSKRFSNSSSDGKFTKYFDTNFRLEYTFSWVVSLLDLLLLV